MHNILNAPSFSSFRVWISLLHIYYYCCLLQLQFARRAINFIGTDRNHDREINNAREYQLNAKKIGIHFLNAGTHILWDEYDFKHVPKVAIWCIA